MRNMTGTRKQELDVPDRLQPLSVRVEQILCGSCGAVLLLVFVAILPATLQMQAPLRREMQRYSIPLSPRAADIALLLVVFSLFAIVTFYKLRSLRRSGQRTERAIIKRIRETDDVTDELLQGVQGLLLTFHVAAQKIAEDHASRRLMEHALSEADELVSNGRRRFERAAFQGAPEHQDDQKDQDDQVDISSKDEDQLPGVLKHTYLESRSHQGKERQ